MEEIQSILKFYNLGARLSNYAAHSHDPDMWSHTFEMDGKRYVLVEVEAIGNGLQDHEYSRLEEDLNISRESMKLVMPKLEQMQTNNNQAGIGIDGHDEVINQDEVVEYITSNDDAQASQYFPPITHEDLPEFQRKAYKNPNGLRTETTWVLFKLN